MKTIKYLTLMLMAIISASVISCNKDDSGAPEIHGVRITDPTKADSLFAQAFPGQMIVIVGKNLQNAKKVFINNQDVSFNANYNTSTHLIVKIPSEEDGFETLFVNPDLPAEIRVETDRGIARYNFLVTYAPSISLVMAETYPIPPNNRMTVTGNNFVDIERVFFTDVPQSQFYEQSLVVQVHNYDVVNRRFLDPVKGYVIQSTMTFRLPADLPRTDGNFFGYFVVEGRGKTAFYQFMTLPAPVIQSISSDMPLPGMQVTINGMYFIDIESVDIGNGEIIILSEDMDELTREKIVFTMPAKPSKSGLKITAFNGEAYIGAFYPYNQLLTDYDDAGKYESWSGDDISFMEANAAEPPYFSDGKYARIKGVYGATWWAGAICMFKDDDRNNIFPPFDKIPANTPASDVYLAYECYNRFSFVGAPAVVRYELLDGNDKNSQYFNYQWDLGAYEVAHPGYDEIALYNQWYTVMVPLNRFDDFKDGALYSDIIARKFNMLHFVVINPQGLGGQPHEIDIFFDNVRFITKPK